MIERGDILSIPYLQKAAFSGSYEGLRFRFARKRAQDPDGGEGKQMLEVTAWEAPYSYDATPEEKKQRMETELSEEGVLAGLDWLNGLWEADPKRYQEAKGKW